MKTYFFVPEDEFHKGTLWVERQLQIVVLIVLSLSLLFHLQLTINCNEEGNYYKNYKIKLRQSLFAHRFKEYLFFVLLQMSMIAHRLQYKVTQRMMPQMQQYFPDQDGFHCCIEGDSARLRIKMEPKSLTILVPLHWQVNQIKCILCNQMPKLQFGMIKLSHDGSEIPGNLTIEELLERDKDQECMLERQYVLDFYRQQDNKTLEFEKYYASKMTPLMKAMSQSPFQPILHPKYYTLQTELVQLKEVNGKNLKFSLQNLVNLRNLLQLDRNNNNGANNGGNNAGNDDFDNVGGLGVPGQGGNPNNRNIFERGALFIFKFIQIFILWQLIQLVFHNISTGHIFILVFVIVIYLGIQHFRKAKDNNNEQNQAQRVQQQEQRQQGEANPEGNQAEQGQEGEREDVIQQDEEDVIQPIVMGHTWVPVLVRILCLIGESLFSFVMSLFPNWTINLHFNMLRDKFQAIDTFLNKWEHPYMTEQEEQSFESHQEENEEEEEVFQRQESGDELRRQEQMIDSKEKND